MNNKHILDLTLRLSQALDQNYDVVSMETVLSVISALEGTTITKEQLEATRLAKYINQLRRRTKCENLARRAKSLLKKWREMVGMQQSSDSSAAAASVINLHGLTAINTNSAATSSFNMPATDNASTSHLNNAEFSLQCQQQYQSKQHMIQQHPCYSQPSSPLNAQEKSSPNELLISMSNPATKSQVTKSSITNARRKRKLEKNTCNELSAGQQQPISFANLITGLGNTLGTTRKIREKDSGVSLVKPVETFIIEHSSNSNSDLICIPSNNNITSATDVPSVVIDLQDTNSSMNSLVSKNVTNTSSSAYRNKISAKKSKKEKKRKDRNLMSHQSQPSQDCDDQNTSAIFYHQNRPSSDALLLDEKSHSACPTLSNISEILSLSNSSMSSLFPSADAVSKNVYQSNQQELLSSASKMTKSDLTFAGKFKQNTSSTSTGNNVMSYNSDNTNLNVINSDSPNENRFSPFADIGTVNSNGSSSNSQTSSFNAVVNSIKTETSNSRHKIDDVTTKHDINEKSMSNMSNKGNSSADNTHAVSESIITETQQHKHADTTTIDFLTQQSVKQPKKRGRKKGSKGVDSVIAKETSLSSQMLMSSLGVTGKKVKTTKELYAEMENRKLRNIAGVGEITSNSSSIWTGQQQPPKSVSSRRPSFCSDIVETDSCTMTSEPSIDSSNILNNTVGKSETHLDNNSNYSKLDAMFKTADVRSDDGGKIVIDQNSALEITSKIKLEIQEVVKLLPLPPSVKEIEHECFINMTPCTCTIEEIIAPANNVLKESIDDHKSKISSFSEAKSKNICEKESNNLKVNLELLKNETENLKGSDKIQKDSLLPLPSAPVKIQKSIFDLDFDDDNDPLKSIIADIEGKHLKTETEVESISHPVIDDKSEYPLSREDDIPTVHHPNSQYALSAITPALDNIVFPTYEVNLDPDCKAKTRFEVQTQNIAKFHVDTLHNCFIPNVNGNWSYADAVSTCNRIKDVVDQENIGSIIDGCNVVPFYSSDRNVRIVKDLSHVKFTKKIRAKHSKCQNQNEVLFHTPFLGVSRITDVSETKFPCEEIEEIKHLTLDEEKENVDNKPNLNNIILNTIAHETIDAKEREEIEMESVQSVETSLTTTKVKSNENPKKSGFKHTRKHATLVKRSTIKRLKMAAKGDLDTSESDSSDSDYVEESKLHKILFYHEEICPVFRSGSYLNKESMFHISSCSSGCSSADEQADNQSFNNRKPNTSTSISASSSEYQMLNLQREIIQAELKKLSAHSCEKQNNVENIDLFSVNNSDDDESTDLPAENNHMLLSFNNIYNKTTRDVNAEKQNKDHENNMLKQQLQNCDDYNNLNNNFNLIKYIDNKTSSVNNINSNNNNSCSNNNSDTSINITSSSCSHESPIKSTIIHLNDSKDKDVQIKPFKEYQTGIRAVDEDVNDDDGNNCARVQQFKEWHEVLQLRSYNDELLTVLPYVVLE